MKAMTLPGGAPWTAVTATVTTPIGPFTVIVDPGPDDRPGGNGGPTVLASGWTGDADDLLALISPVLRPSTVRPVPAEHGSVAAVTAAVNAYHRGELDGIDGIAVRQTGGPYLDHAWQVLRQVPAGDPLSYTGFADRTGRPAAVRAAAAACARNAAALFVPCHRILRSDGSLGGFRWGLPAKAWLLDHESARSVNQPALRASS